MRSRNTSLLSAVLILLSITNSTYAYRKVIDLGPGIAYSINNNGQVVGESGNHAVIFDTTGQGNNRDLGTLGSHTSSHAFSINNNDQVVGISYNDPYGQHACRFDSTGGGANIDLGDLGGHRSEATSINNNGQIVGHALTSYNAFRACIFDHEGGGVIQDLGALGGPSSLAYSINESGRIVGSAKYTERPYDVGIYHACFFDETGGGANIDLGTLGGEESFARFINNSNQIVGYASIPAADPRLEDYFHAALFDSSGSGNNKDLGTLGGEESWAYAINDLGQIVGEAMDSLGTNRACLFDITGFGNNIDLNTLINPDSDWDLRYAYSINNDGWIVGIGTHRSYWRAYLLTPEPGTVLLFGFGGMAILRRRKVSHKIIVEKRNDI